MQKSSIQKVQIEVNALVSRHWWLDGFSSRILGSLLVTTYQAGKLVVVRPDLDKTKAISEFPTPKDLTQLRSFLGLANQLTVFLPDFVQNTTRMRQLLKKTTAWLWTAEIDAQYRRVKEPLPSDALVKPFDPELDTKLLTDASRLHGLGYALVQSTSGNLRLIACGSKSLTPTQQRYSTVELEMMAVKWAFEDNNYYLRGIRLCTVLTDHRPVRKATPGDHPGRP